MRRAAGLDALNVRFGSVADIDPGAGDVRFRGKADMEIRLENVR